MMTTNKRDKSFIVLSTIICLLPIAMYLMVYDQLPEQMGMQWDLEGNVNWYAPRAAAVFGVPAALAIIHLASVFIRRNDPKRENASAVMQSIRDWIVPIVSILASVYSLLLNTGTSITRTIPLIAVGVILIIIGNYIPKSRQNYTIGIRLPWTLDNVDNWNKTHRMAGYLRVLSGAVLIICPVLPVPTVALLSIILGTLLLCVILPVLYSFSIYKKEEKPN
jgi:uncharacterized membrane protein